MYNFGVVESTDDRHGRRFETLTDLRSYLKQAITVARRSHNSHCIRVMPLTRKGADRMHYCRWAWTPGRGWESHPIPPASWTSLPKG